MGFSEAPYVVDRLIRHIGGEVAAWLADPRKICLFALPSGDELFEAFPHGSSDLERPKPGGMIMEMSRDH
jgi:hypothetical protein